MKLKITEKSIALINGLIEKGWECMLHWGDHKTYTRIKGNTWEVDFTRKKANGLWDNHQDGYSKDINKAIAAAYKNVKEGKKLKKGNK